MMMNHYGRTFDHRYFTRNVMFSVHALLVIFLSDIVPEEIEEKNVLLPDENHLYGAISDFITVQKARNLTVRDLIDGHLPQDLTVNAALTSKRIHGMHFLYVGKRRSQ